MGKIPNCGAIGMMVGYCKQHSAGTYCIFLLDSQTVIETRDVQWLNQYFGDWYSTDNNPNPDPSDDDNNLDSDNEHMILYRLHCNYDELDDGVGGLVNNNNNNESNEDDDSQNINNNDNGGNFSDNDSSSDKDNDKNDDDEDNNPYQKFYNKPAQKAEHSMRTTRASTRVNNQSESETPQTDKLINELKKLNTSYNPTINTKQSDVCFSSIDFGLHSAVNSNYNKPGSYMQMLKRPIEERRKWLGGCKEESTNIKKKKVWKLIPISEIP